MPTASRAKACKDCDGIARCVRSSVAMRQVNCVTACIDACMGNEGGWEQKQRKYQRKSMQTGSHSNLLLVISASQNGFKCHIMSESHQRQLLLVAENEQKFVQGFSDQFLKNFLTLLKRRYNTKYVVRGSVLCACVCLCVCASVRVCCAVLCCVVLCCVVLCCVVLCCVVLCCVVCARARRLPANPR